MGEHLATIEEEIATIIAPGAAAQDVSQHIESKVDSAISAAREHLFFPGHGERAWPGLKSRLHPTSNDPNSPYRILIGLQSHPEWNGRVVIIDGAETDGFILVPVKRVS